MVVVLLPVVVSPAGQDFTVYDAYINDGSDLGLFFLDEQKPSTDGLPLKQVRQDVGNSPWEVRPEFGDVFAQADFSEGSGQRHFHRQNRNERKYLRSEGFDISIPGKLTHLNAATSAFASTTIGSMTQAMGLPFACNGTSIRRGDGAFPGVWTDDNPHLAEGSQPVNDITSSGNEVFAALGVNGIHRRNAAGTWTHYSNIAATVVSWAKQRLMAADGQSIYNPTDAAPNPAALDTLPAGWVFTDIAEAGGFILATAVSTNGGLGEIRAYGLSSALALELKATTPLPRGQLPYSVAGYLDTVYVGCGKANKDGGYDPILYQAFPDANGALQLIKLREDKGSGATDLSVSAIAPRGEDVLYGWSLGSTADEPQRTGIGVHHLARDALANHLKSASTSAKVLGILVFKDRILFSVSGVGIFYEDVATAVTTAELVTSIADWLNSGFKVWDKIQISHKPLPASSSVTVDYSTKLPEEGEWFNAMTSNITGAEGREVILTNSVKSRLFALRLTSTKSGSGAPVLLGFGVRSNPAPEKAEWRLTRFVRVLARDRKDDRGEVVYQDPFALRLRLQSMRHFWVTLYEPGFTWLVWVEDVSDVEPVQPLVMQTTGESSKEFYAMKLTLIGTKAS